LFDIGYSEGSFTDYLAESAWRCSGFDLNRHEHAMIKMIVCDLDEAFPVESDIFDGVTAGKGIEHVLDEGALLRVLS